MTRFYPFEEIGSVSRNARLNFDAYGRLAVIQDGAYVVLNDATWIDLAGRQLGMDAMLNVVRGADGRWYYGSLGTWGVAEYTADGRLRARPLVPANAPKWIATTNFSELLPTHEGFLSAGWNGLVYTDYADGAQTFIPVTELSRLFSIGEQVFVSAHNRGLQVVDLANRTLRPVPGTDLGGAAIDEVTSLDNKRVLLSTIEGRLFIFDGTTAQPWESGLGNGPNNRVSALLRLEDGVLAIAINGRGLYLVSPTGDIRFALTSPEYHRVTDLATREPGVLWVATENGVEKVLYGSPVTMFGQRLGLPVSWPQVVQRNGRVVIASGGRLYEAVPGAPGHVGGFKVVPDQPATGVWAIAAKGPHMLVGNAKAVFEFEPGGRFTPVLAPIDAARLVMVSPDLCYVIGMAEIAALRWTGDRWVESAPRVHGVGYPSVVHAAGHSAWIELGPNRAARVTLHGAKLETRVFEQFPWSDPHWINVGAVGDTVVLTGPNAGRVFFDEKTEAFCAAPELERLLDIAPFPITRVQADDDGLLWASHERGILTINPRAPEAPFDTATFDIINERAPIVQLLPGPDVWVSSGHALYHVDRKSGTDLRQSFKPVLISVVDGRTNANLRLPEAATRGTEAFPYAKNNLSFRFFAGSYASRRAPSYEFKLNEPADKWTTLASGSVINFHELREGAYRLDVRLTDSHGPLGSPISLGFTILPPWYRTWYASVLWCAAAAGAIGLLIRWSIHRSHARNLVLEQLVRKRTEELRATMAQLADETRNAATLAERNRLAAEIHDSLQQGLSGLILQLDATLKLRGLTGDVRSRLNVARNMVSFTRHEVQHAVWDLESPLLEGNDLEDALRKITALISPGAMRIEITVAGSPIPLSSELKHHLLRLAQEAITNAVRHAAATLLRLELTYLTDAVTLAVTDNGRGFDPDEVMSNGLGHFGLRGLRGRADKIGGDLQVLSSPGHGTSIRVVVPIGRPAPHSLHATADAK